jgi:hypothetical protein
MTTVGMLHHRLDPRKVRRAYAYAAVAKAEGIDFFYFTPGRVQLDDRTIRAQILENGEWIEKIVPFPDVIYNSSSPMTEKAYEIYDKLEETIPFTSHSIGDKLTVYKSIKKNKEFSHYLLPTQEIKHPKTVFEGLKYYQKIVLKPISGSQGTGLLFIEEKQHHVIVRNQWAETLDYDKESFIQYLQLLIKEEPYLMQRFICCQTKSELAFDFRLHVQKNGAGKWVIATIYPRIASFGKIVTNLNNNGYTMSLPFFLNEEFGDRDYNMQRYLECFALSFAEHMDNIYDQSLDELGIDVGLDANQKIWIYEVNWRPGTPPVFHMELDIAINTIHYAVYLAAQQ